MAPKVQAPRPLGVELGKEAEAGRVALTASHRGISTRQGAATCCFTAAFAAAAMDFVVGSVFVVAISYPAMARSFSAERGSA